MTKRPTKTPVAPPPPPPPPPADEPTPRRRTRNTIQQAVYLHPAAYEQLRWLAFNKRIKMHDVLMRGLDLAFHEAGVKSIDELKRTDDPREQKMKKGRRKER